MYNYLDETIQNILDTAIEEARPKIALGKTASYIPELSFVDPNLLGVCIRTRDGRYFESGDTDVRFTIQSISKVITLAIALEVLGFQKVFSKVRMEPSGDSFNSLIKLDMSSDHPYNPMINSGAIAIASYLTSFTSFEEVLQFTRKLCMDDAITMNEKVYHSEMSHISRNRAIAYLLDSKGILDDDVEKSLAFYTEMCSLNVTANSLAGFGLILANDGVHPFTEERLLNSKVVKVVKTIMLTCGMYDGSGEFAVRVGVPSKSGVGGGILSVVDKQMGIGIFGPSLDSKGNSVAGQYILEILSRKLKLHLFDAED